MKTKTGAIIALTALFAAGAASAHGVRYVKVRVIAAEPVYERVVVSQPVTRCSTQIVERRVASPAIAGQTLAGAIIGAAIGRQFGDGRGQDALTLAGAIAGSAVANDRALRRHSGDVRIVREPVERCTTEYHRQPQRRITGYWVDYRYRGRYYRVLHPEAPGRHIRIAVSS
jgi:uncharacterized protein YcfJ